MCQVPYRQPTYSEENGECGIITFRLTTYISWRINKYAITVGEPLNEKRNFKEKGVQGKWIEMTITSTGIKKTTHNEAGGIF